jgi:hypothetical protein
MTLRGFVEWHGIPFHHVPVTADNKNAGLCRGAASVRRGAATPWCWRVTCKSCRRPYAATYPGRIINIHHSFLPSFVGAKPYHQAYERGVKLIGATCHYVTDELDQGPIIEQDVIRIDHSDSAGGHGALRQGHRENRAGARPALTTWKTGCWSTATRPSSFAERSTALSATNVRSGPRPCPRGTPARQGRDAAICPAAPPFARPSARRCLPLADPSLA